MWSTSAKSSSSDGRESAQDVDVLGLCGDEAELLAADCSDLDCTSCEDVGLLGVTLSCEMRETGFVSVSLFKVAAGGCDCCIATI